MFYRTVECLYCAKLIKRERAIEYFWISWSSSRRRVQIEDFWLCPRCCPAIAKYCINGVFYDEFNKVLDEKT